MTVAAHLQPQMQVLRVRDVVRRHQPWAERAKSLTVLPLIPLTTALELEFPFRDVVEYGVTGYMLERPTLGDVARAASDDDGEFNFPVGLLRAAREHDWVIGTLERMPTLEKQNRFRRDRLP